MEKKVLEILSEACPDIDFTASDKLVDDGILDSLTLTEIITELTVEFGIEIPYEEIVEENFNSVKAMTELVQRLM